MKEDILYRLPSGTILKGRYRIEEKLGSGGFGITYRGTETQIGLRIAIKEYYPYGHVMRNALVSCDVMPKADEKSRQIYFSGKEKFLEEARKLALCDPIGSVVGVRDFFEENQTAYIVMEYLEGVTLKRYLEMHGRMDCRRLCEMVLPLLRDLEKVHDLGVLHRDISPDNIMLVEGERLRLLDFGAARDFELGTDQSMTVMFKHGFAPSEQYTRHGNQGAWTDIYALGATMYACLTGVEPDAATDRIEQDLLKPPSALDAAVPDAVERVILKSMKLRAEHRYQSAAEMADALEAAVSRAFLKRGKSNTEKSEKGINRIARWLRGLGEDRTRHVSIEQADRRNSCLTAALTASILLIVVMAAVLYVVLNPGNLLKNGIRIWMPDSGGEIAASSIDEGRRPENTDTLIQTAEPTGLPTWAPTEAPTKMPTQKPTAKPRTVYPGDRIIFGRYDIDRNPANGTEEIEWRVLAVEEGEALMITQYLIEEINFNSVKEKISWEDASLRHWLNTNFLQQAFSPEERSAISVSVCNNDRDQGVPKKSTGGRATQDQVFLLSYREAVRYFEDNKDRIAVTYGKNEAERMIRPWWLRSISETRQGTAVVEKDGRCTATRAVVYEDIYVRPAVRVRIDRLPAAQ